jgi:phosphoribosyl-ATP pyrophosphohydrolase/phosphoribosyl-AMP cyclohydrolase
MMNSKKFIASLYISQGHAVKSLKDKTIIETDPVKLARYYEMHQADALLIFDLSAQADTAPQDRDRLHESFMLILREICAKVKIDVIGAGGVKRMEDIKKLLYAGCRWAVLNFDLPSNIAIAQEVGQKFGANRLIASYSNPTILTEQKTLLEKYVSYCLLLTPHKVRESIGLTSHPILVQASMLMLNKLIEILAQADIRGITGNVVNENVKELPSIKKLCKENGIPVDTLKAMTSFSAFKTNQEGLVPVVVQEENTNEVLMVAYMNEEAYEHTLETGRMTYFSRSRQELWEKGATSGHFQYVKNLRGDCDMDTILATVTQIGAACHTGSKSCFFHELLDFNTTTADYPEAANDTQKLQDHDPLTVLTQVYDVIQDRKIHPKEGSYTNYLFDKGLDKILKKLGEEATEIVIAAKNPVNEDIKYEIGDFLYHMMVLMAEKGLSWDEITEELAKR